MKRLLWALGIIALLEVAWIAVTPILTTAQSFWPPPVIATTDPVGACANGTFYVNITTPSLWYCGGSAWNDASGGASGANTSLSNLTSPTAINDTTLTFAGAGGLTAGGTNQNITLAPTTAGYVKVNNSFGNLYLSPLSGRVNIYSPSDLRLGGSSSSASYLDINTASDGGRIGLNKGLIQSFQAVTFSATPTFDAQSYSVFKITLTGNVTSSSLPNQAAGETLKFIICQDASGSRTFAWPTNALGGMTIGATASKCSAQEFISDGTNAYALTSGVTNM